MRPRLCAVRPLLCADVARRPTHTAAATVDAPPAADSTALDWTAALPPEYSRGRLFDVERRWHHAVRNTPRPAGDPASKHYALCMFPYPSGSLHMGHVRVYTISDALARRHRQKTGGKAAVLHPMGWDAFGLPAENAARHRGLDPAKWTHSNIETMREQLVRLGCDFDWDRELCTSSPSYYKWTQWLFCQLHAHGLAGKRLSFVNWDPVDGTVLADEQIDDDGVSWRSGAKVQRRALSQWFVRTSRFAEALYNGLDGLPHWPDQVRAIQRNWIGPPDFYAFHLQPFGDGQLGSLEIRVRDPGTIAKADFVAVKDGHLWAAGRSVGDLVAHVCVPVLGRRLPVYVTAADDSRFDDVLDVRLGGSALFADDTAIFRGNRQRADVTAEKLVEHAQANGWGGYMTSGRIRDWCVSRQRAWGTPVPAVHCPNCGPSTANADELPIEHGGDAQATCSCCGARSPLDGDTLDTFFDSSWYFVRYLDPGNDRELCDGRLARRYLPVDLYVGGLEHAALHLYYARFMSHFMHARLRLVPTAEPFVRLLPQGIVKGRTFVRDDGAYLPHGSVEKSADGSLIAKDTGERVQEVWTKMSKSKFNGVDPSDLISEFGTDLTRLTMLSNVSPYSDRNWDNQMFKGVENWVRRSWYCVARYCAGDGGGADVDQKRLAKDDADLKKAYNQFVRTTRYNMDETRLLNVAVSRLMGLTSALRKRADRAAAVSLEYERCVFALAIMLYPMAPHVAMEWFAALCQAARRRRTDYGRTIGHLATEALRRKMWQMRWPPVDDDANLDLFFTINGVHAGRAKAMPRQRLDSMTADAAWHIARRTRQTKTILSGRPVLAYELVDYEAFGRQLAITAEGDIDRWIKADVKRTF